jgi:hypothetical protein
MVMMLRSLCLFPFIVLPVYAVTGALLNLLMPVHSTGTFWGDVLGWAAVGWFVPLVLLPAALALHLIAQWLPHRWTHSERRTTILVSSPLLFLVSFGVAALALTGDAPLLKSPHALVLVVPALVYGAVVPFPNERAI